MSPIHDQTYRRYEGTRQPPGRAWLVITRAGIRTMMARKWLWMLLILAWIPFIVNVVRLYVASSLPANMVGAARSFLAVTPQTFRSFLEAQGLFVFFVTLYVGAELIANDRRANALQIYLSRPLGRLEYIAGKFSVLFIFLLSITLLPSLLLVLIQAMFAGSFEFIRANLFLIPSITLGCLLESVVATSTMLALSSLSNSRRYAALLYTGAVFFTNAMYAVLLVITGGTRVAWVSITSNLDQVVDVIFRQTPRYETPWGLSLLVLAGLLVLSISVLERRVRGVEIVS
jgi:ABC-2 type transport system permease protein